MGHRVPNHKNKCRRPHGHRYRLELTLKGSVCRQQGHSDEGMVFDFGDIRAILRSRIHDRLDHCFMISHQDPLLTQWASEQAEEAGFFLVDFIPTAENIVIWCYEQLRPVLPAEVRIAALRLYETPNAWADFRPDDQSSVRFPEQRLS